MKIEKQFEVAQPRRTVWEALGDVRLVAECLPGATIVDDLGENRYKGRFSIKLGPLAASFDGEVAVERKAEEWMAVVSGKGADARSASRASGSMTYRLAESVPGSTRVEVVSEINLAGALAQFGKAGVIQEVANRVTAEFVRNFEAKLAGRGGEDAAAAPAAPAQPSAAPQSLNAGALLWSIVKERILGFLRRLTGRRTG
jgi:uncharacterized protein